MRIQIRTINQTNFDLEVESTFTIAKIKELISEKTQQTVVTQTLIFAGKLLDNSETLAQANIKENDFLVLVSKKTTTKPAAPTTTQQPQPSQPVSTPATTTGPPQPSVKADPPPAQNTAPPAAQPKPDTPASSTSTETTGLYSESAQALLVGPQFNSMVDEISNSMGFPKEQVSLALRASFGNPDRAVEYLLSGEIPESVLSQVQPPAPAQNRPAAARPPTTPAQPAPSQTPAQTQTQTPASGSTTQTPQNRPTQTPSNAPVRPTTTQPRVLMTGGVVLPENIIPPALASRIPNLRPQSPPVAGGVPRATGGAAGAAGAGGAQNPMEALRDNPMFASLQQLARNDPQRFQELMNQLIQSNPQLGQLLAQHGNEFMQLLRGGAARPQGIQLQITQQDQEALQRLTSLGFSRNRAIEAYFLFEKSEDAAANYLLNTKDDEDEMEFLEGDMEDDDNPDDAN